MRAAFALHHRMHEPALQFQPVVALLLQIRDGVLAKKFRRDVLRRSFARERLHAALAKLEHVPVIVGTRPGATLAIEPVLLVYREPAAEPAANPHLTQRKLCAADNRGQARGDLVRFGDFGPACFGWRLGSGCVVRRFFRFHFDAVVIKRITSRRQSALIGNEMTCGDFGDVLLLVL